MAATTVVYFSSTDTGAPTLNNVNGSMIALLDACLINGYNLKTITTLTVASGVATATCSGHGFPDDSVNLVAGATPAGLNGNRRITVVNANTFTFDATGVADGAATGTITIKRAPLGWTKAFSSGTTKAVYARSDPSATAMVLRIEDAGSGITDPKYARAIMYESMTDVDTGSAGRSPTIAGSVDGQFWHKGTNDATAKRWLLVGDSRTFYLFTDAAGQFGTYGTLGCSAFGDVRSFRAGDPWAAFINGSNSANNYGTTSGVGYGGSLGGAPGSHITNGLIRSAGSVVPASVGFSPIGHGYSVTGGNNAPKYPSPVDNGCALVPNMLISEDNPAFNYPIRGELRGLGEILSAVNAALRFQTLKSLVGSDRTWLVVPAPYTGSSPGAIAVDVSGPWA